MICEPCKLGADIQRYNEKTFSSGFHVQFNNVSQALHNKCKGKTHCDCQHMPVGNLVRSSNGETDSSARSLQ